MNRLAGVVLLFFCVVVCTSGLSVQVEANKEECFTEMMKKDTKMGVYFQVSEGGFLDIDVTVSGPDDRILHKIERKQDDRFTFVAYESGPYSICFSNKMSTLTPKTVMFHLLPENRVEFHELAKLDHLSPIEESLLRLADGLGDIQQEQVYMRNRERAHRNTSESTNTRVLWWSFFEALVLVAMSIWQVYYITRYFEVKEEFRHV